MKKLLSFFIFTSMVVALNSCRDLPQNGDFSGFWQITAIRDADGTEQPVDRNHFYGFYRTVFNLLGGHNLTEPDMTYYAEKTGNLAYYGTSFVLEFPRFEPSWDLTSWGFPERPDGVVYKVPVHAYYTINSLDGDALVMTLDRITDADQEYPAGITIVCRRY